MFDIFIFLYHLVYDMLQRAYTCIEDITRWREDMNFMFEWQTQYLTSLLRSLVRYCVCHSNIKFISSSQRVMFLLYGEKISEIAHFYSLLVASVEKFFKNLQIVQGLPFLCFRCRSFLKTVSLVHRLVKQTCLLPP